MGKKPNKQVEYTDSEDDAPVEVKLSETKKTL